MHPGVPHQLQQRAKCLGKARQFFADKGVLEVETPVLNQYPVTDPQVDCLRSTTAQNRPLWLRPSSEYSMKRLLAAGSGDIYEIGKVFRAGESGSRHSNEFTMIEWYRAGFTMQDMIDETVELLRAVTGEAAHPVQSVEQLTYVDAFQNHAALNPLTATAEELEKRSKSLLGSLISDHLIDTFEGNRELFLDLLMSHYIEEQFAADTLTVITHYPANQAVLARLDPDNAAVAERFEIYYRGIELANGFRELTDAAEQRQRFEHDQELRREQEKPVPKIDEDFLAALEKGLPECSGVAVGLDRLLMAAEGYDTISATVGLPQQ